MLTQTTPMFLRLAPSQLTLCFDVQPARFNEFSQPEENAPYPEFDLFNAGDPWDVTWASGYL